MTWTRNLRLMASMVGTMFFGQAAAAEDHDGLHQTAGGVARFPSRPTPSFLRRWYPLALPWAATGYRVRYKGFPQGQSA